jgi:hypothetical protein
VLHFTARLTISVAIKKAAGQFRKKVYRTIEELQADLDAWIKGYNEERPHQGRWCYGKTPIQTFLDSLPLAKEKLIAA